MVKSTQFEQGQRYTSTDGTLVMDVLGRSYYNTGYIIGLNGKNRRIKVIMVKFSGEVQLAYAVEPLRLYKKENGDTYEVVTDTIYGKPYVFTSGGEGGECEGEGFMAV